MVNQPDPQILYRLCTSKQALAQQQGFQQLGAILFRVARARLNAASFTEADVQDCVQEALGSIWQKLQNDQHPQLESFIRWSIAIVVFKCIDLVRWRQRRPAVAWEDQTDETLNQQLMESDHPERLLPEQLVELDESKTRLLLSINQHPDLSQASKQILIQGFLFEKNDEELSTLLDTTRGNIQVIRSRNYKKLRADQNWLTRLRA